MALKNGLLPGRALRRLKFSPGHRLRKSPAKALDALAFKMRRRLGSFPGVNDSYRPISIQWRFWRRWGAARAAYPGYSNHGWGKAVDLALGGFHSREYRWMRYHGRRYGWWQPPQFRQFGRKPEWWHFEYRRRYDRSRAVQRLQRFLRKAYGYRGGIDRVWGDGTDGPAQKMWAQLKRHPWRKRRIKRLQRILKFAGTYGGRIDGDNGPRTRRAWREFYGDFYCGSK